MSSDLHVASAPAARVEPAAGAPRFSAAWLLDGPGWPVLRVVVDAVMLTLACLAAVLGAPDRAVDGARAELLVVFPPAVMVMLWLRGMYRRRLRVLILDGVMPVIGAISIAAMAVIALDAVDDANASVVPLVTRAWLFGLLYVGAGRIIMVLTQRRARRRRLVARPTLIVGAGLVGAQVTRRLEEHPEYGLRPVGYLDADPRPAGDVEDRRVPILGAPSDLARVAAATGAQHVILAFISAADRDLVAVSRRCDELGLEVSLVPRLFDAVNERVALEHVGGLPLLGLRTVDPKGWQFALKHGLDRLVAATAIFAILPLLLTVALLVRLSSPGPVLYRQRRVGRDGQVFDLLKFRSMRVDGHLPENVRAFTPEPGKAPGGVEGGDRRTPIGTWLRRTSIDELPQLLNVLRGDMSLVGPRPERPEYVELFQRGVNRYGDRHRVKSGITGWAQVHGLRGQTSIADRVEWDNFYIENWSLALDLKILVLTVLAVFRAGRDA